MKRIELKTFNPTVFDDPEFCREVYKLKPEKCKYLGSELRENYCGLFKNSLNYVSDSPTKCQECKNHYQRNKDNPKPWYKLTFNEETGKTERLFYDEDDRK